MKKQFISVPTKLLILIIGTLLLVTSGFACLSLLRLQNEFKQFQTTALQHGQVQFYLQSNILQRQLRIWLESFSGIARLYRQDDFKKLALNLGRQFEILQMQLNVENVWLVKESGQELYGTGVLPSDIKDKISATLKLQHPHNDVLCDQLCLQLITIPVFNKQGELAVIAITASLVDMLFAIGQSLENEVAIVSYPRQGKPQVQQASIISSSNRELINILLYGEQGRQLVSQVSNTGLQAEVEQLSYLVNFLSLSENQQRVFFLVLIHDMTPFTLKHDEDRRQFLWSVSIIFFTLAMLVFYITGPFSQRLLALSDALPLLARKHFAEFRQVEFRRMRLFSDELDVLSDAALELSFELEQLDQNIEQKARELENIAMYDLLTGLPSRNMLNHKLNKAVAMIEKHHGGLAVLFLDLDNFKKVNVSYGHDEGDRLLIEAANRIRLALRKDDLACRFGGDEFVIVLGELKNEQQAVEIAEQVLKQFKQPIRLDASIFYISSSIGIAYTEDPKAKAEQLISFADIAMYEAKKDGGGQYHVHHSEMYQRIARHVFLEGEVRQALEKKQFSLSLQPQLETKSRKLYGFEVLLRWHHPKRGLIPPDDFIPILENSAYMLELSYWVLRRSFELLLEIQKLGLTQVRMAVNLSAGQFVDPKLPDYLQALLAEFSVSARHFELELTEQTLVKDINVAIEVMSALRELGFSFAIDDFGTGYSSLAYLKKMPVDVIKIDKSFVFGMLENNADYQIIISTIAMVKNLGLQVVAEGVETGAQLQALTQHDCDYIQGYYFSRPVPEVELADFIHEKIIDGFWLPKKP
ncbi:putative bifunctional diguanylate cyclase/phosphodiesterase [Thalassomonas actiniarum]|uniref:EAL domain-containing protein n=1 Tax=Thalassomonas actiniarum TaxID=485447 RepID=A0AAF0C333_9GAMM|nr:EAL domain-containing protein [Thalassomonas actiniarum]WDD98259.1 EAL domain-containing protein [Thalassomonas actiniarum]